MSAKKPGEGPAKPDNAKSAADPFGAPKKKQDGKWTHAAMDEALREPRLDGNDDKVAKEELDAEKK
ncbi:hypothetical protein ACEWPL_002785 [Roseovarius sp. S1116L3]|uniref:hypothetical protein n=1 Tax=Roseovarius roseus TaxID=3342636 RepID=UPI00372B7E8A